MTESFQGSGYEKKLCMSRVSRNKNRKKRSLVEEVSNH